MENKVLIAPSILSADFSRLGEEIKLVEKAGADWIHVDVMDGVFVPNITIGPLVVKAVRPLTSLLFDVHLMIDDPVRYVDQFAASGADLVTFHVEACKNSKEVIEKIRTNGKKVGISISPGTPVTAIQDVLDKVDLVLVMTVKPGFSGQSFMAECLEKIGEIRKKYSGYVQVDGGINEETARGAISAGSDILVAGTAVFGEKDYAEAIKKLR
ncbi:MAG: ribulose-phosphate 3-epimerase [Candidatus Omnitrophica bacterium]|nr:ribulose-phosphate 3-epimerase [Candidatus Omnitrophota bacterium]